MGRVFKFVGDIFDGGGGKKKKAAPEEEDKPTVLPMPDDPDIREKMLAAQMKARGRKGRDYTRNPGGQNMGGRSILG